MANKKPTRYGSFRRLIRFFKGLFGLVFLVLKVLERLRDFLG